MGRISYGLYLWHWPVYLTLTQTRTGLDGFWLLALRVAVSVGLAALSFYALERPIRAGTFRLPKPQIVAIAVVSALVVAVFATTIGGDDSVAADAERALRANAPVPKSAPAARPHPLPTPRPAPP